MTAAGRSFTVVPGGGDDQLAALRRRCAAVERAASELAEDVRRLTGEVTTLVERPTTQPKAVSVDDAAQLLGLGRSSLYELIETGRIRSVKVGSRRLVPMAAIDEFLSGALRVEAS
ncbi:MAG: excisionase family DNA-binding protein [Acidimicrobiales bacterium]